MTTFTQSSRIFWTTYVLFAILFFAFFVVFALFWNSEFNTLRNHQMSEANISHNPRLTGQDSNTQDVNREQPVYTYVKLSKANQKLRGKFIVEQGIKLAQFTGVRYAQKPKRFKKAQPPLVWSGTKDALHWPPHCMQNNLKQYEYLTEIYNYNVSEDCLYMNIWSPWADLVDLTANRTLSEDNRTNNSRLPVVIFIHGGAFNYMGISMEAYYGGVIAAIGKVVFITINYRVGLFGFLDNQLEESSKVYGKNIGLYDQIAAIQWVRKNIHAFGGDPNLITLQGQSAGAISIGLLMTSPLARTLFQRAILQSASPMMLKQIFTSSHYSQVTEMANCTEDYDTKTMTSFLEEDNSYSSLPIPTDLDDYYEYADDQIDAEKNLKEIECLENVNDKTLNQIQNRIIRKNPISFSPIIPSKLLPDFPEHQLKGKEIFQKNILLGANANESSLYIHQEFPKLFPLKENLNITISELLLVMERLDNTTKMRNFGPLILNEFKRLNVVQEKDVVQHFLIFLSDFIFKGPVFKFAKLLSQNQNTDVYMYLFNERGNQFPKWIGSSHWNEMDFVFGMPLLHPDRFSKSQRDLSIRMIKSWAHFAKTGTMLPQHEVKWPRVDDNNYHMTLEANNASIGTYLNMMFYRYYDLLYDAS